MRVLVAGGAGFIGSHVCRRLLAAGHEVTCLDNLLTGSRDNVADLAGDPRFSFLERDVVDAPDGDWHVVIHLASPASPVDFATLTEEIMRANALGTWRLIEVSRASGAHLTFASTSEVYGDPLVHPQPETYRGNVDPVGPRACYDESKRFGEALIASYRRRDGLRASIVRIFNTYGPGMRADDGRVIPELISAALEGRPLTVHGDGRQTRSFTYVTDLVTGLLHVALDPAADGEVLNVGSPHEVTILEVAEAIRAIVDPGAPIEHLPVREDDPRRRQADIGRMRQRYGWGPTVGLPEGLAETARWFADRRAAAQPTTIARA